jgi:uncharacterized protein with ParB-like and HNH nuclease domain
MSYQTAKTIKDVISSIQNKDYVLPSIQREFVWDTIQIETLFDSLMRDYPIGTFLFWQMDKDKVKEFEFYEFLDKYHERDSRHNKKANLPKEKGVIAVLDGQQRMTSLFIALCGSYSEKKKYARKSATASYQEKRLYLNLLKKSEEAEREYEFRFLTKDEAQSKEGFFWFDCSKVLELEDMSDVSTFLMENDLMNTSLYPREQGKFAINTLNAFFNVVHQQGTVSFFLEKEGDLDRVLQIFIRVNSGGTKLSYSDLLLSIATAKWEERDAREVIHGFVDELNKIGTGFKFDKDIVLKACLVLSDFGDVRFSGDNFTKENMAKIEQNWDRISASLRSSVDLVSRLGYNKDNLIATNALIPISYFVYKNKFEEVIVSSSHRETDRKAIGEWLARVSLKGVFGGQPDSIYPGMRDVINENIGAFPLEKIIEKYKGTKNSIVFSEDDIDSVLDLRYGEKKTYCALTFLYPSLHYSAVKHDQDHLHPKSFFSKKTLKKNGVGEGDIDKYIEQVNDLANLQLLETTPNKEKLNKPLNDWLEKTYPSAEDRRYFLERNHIGQEQDLSLTAFLDFMEKRRVKLKDKLTEILGK